MPDTNLPNQTIDSIASPNSEPVTNSDPHPPLVAPVRTAPEIRAPQPVTPKDPKLAPETLAAPVPGNPTQAPAAAPTQAPAPAPKPAPKIMQSPILWNKTQEVLFKLEQKLGGKVVSYFTTGGIVSDDVKYFQAHLQEIGFQEKLFFMIVSDGGDGKSAYRIASLLKSYCKELVVVIPEKAASAATMLSLAGDALIMTPLAYLTAVDTSIVHALNPKDKDNHPVRIELEEVKRAVAVLMQGRKSDQDNTEVYKTIFNYIHPAAFGAMERTSNLSEMLCRDILELRQAPLADDAKDKLIDKLNHDYPAHGYPITKRKARELGLNVQDTDAELDDLLWTYLNLNRFITEPVRTDLTDSFFHTEKVANIIESHGRRFQVKNTLERRLDPVIRGWTTLKDEWKWVSMYEAEVNGKKELQISYIDF